MSTVTVLSGLFFFNDTATTEIYTLSLHDALPIFSSGTHSLSTLSLTGNVLVDGGAVNVAGAYSASTTTLNGGTRTDEHTTELQSPCNVVCRLLLEKKNHTGIGLPTWAGAPKRGSG